MALAFNRLGVAESKTMRRKAGAYLRSLREERGLTQRDVAEKLGYDYYTMISQVETGAARLPPEDVLAWAAIYGIDASEMARRLLYFYDPFTFQAVFGGPNPLTAEGLAAEPDRPWATNQARRKKPKPGKEKAGHDPAGSDPSASEAGK